MIQDPNQSSFGLAPNVAAGLASFFTLLGGIVILLGKPPQAWVRFVAVQSIVMCVAYFIAIIAITVISTMLAIAHLGILSLFLWIVQMLIGLGYFIAWIVQTIQAFQGKATRFPLISTWTDRWVPASSQIG
jgi:uncharacterized membrane protein